MKIEDLPQEIHDMFDNIVAAAECRDAAIKSVFRASRALYYAKKRQKMNEKAWEMIRQLYPQTKIGRWTYDIQTKALYSEVGTDIPYVGPTDSEPVDDKQD
jgi:hypothetical protein